MRGEEDSGHALKLDNFAVLAIAAIQEQQKMIAKLEKEVSALGKPAHVKPAKKKASPK